jgi:hypothetical protein
MRPLPNIPRLTRRKPLPPTRILLGCPRISPEWELSALQALMKPQLKNAILHRSAGQRLSAAARTRVENAIGVLATRTGYRPAVHWPMTGDYLFAFEVLPAELEEAKGLALVLSRQLPGTWLVIGRWFIQDGQFFRRERRFKLNLVPATNIHLSRPIRAALNGVLRCDPSLSGPKRSRRAAVAR